MKLHGHNGGQDALDEILRKYLLDQNPLDADGENIMEMAGESALNQPETIVPVPEKEAEMIERLSRAFPESPVPGPVSGGSFWKFAMFGTGITAVITTAFLLFFNPFDEDNSTLSSEIKNLSSQNIHAPDVNEPAVLLKDIEEEHQNTISLLQGDGNAVLPKNIGNEIGTARDDRKQSFYRVNNDAGFNLNSGHPNTPLDITLDDGTVEEKLFMPPIPIDQLFSQTRTQSRFFQIESDSDHLIKGQNGTWFHIPADAFIDPETGATVKGNVQLELREIYEISDYISSDITTLSNKRQLSSGGVVYISASKDNKVLKINKERDIFVEFSDNYIHNTSDMAAWNGIMDSNNELNWIPSGNAFSKMIPLPVDRMYFEEFGCDCNDRKVWNDMLYLLADPANERTWIATREFRDRVRVLKEMGYYDQGLAKYLDNTEMDLWKVDRMIAEMIRSSKMRNTKAEQYADQFDAFSQQMLTSIESYNDFGLNLAATDARKQLLLRKVSEKDSEKLIRIYKLRREYAEEIEKNLVLTRKGKITFALRAKKNDYPSYVPNRAVILKETGWVNFNKISGNDFSGNKVKDLKVRLSGFDPRYASKVYLVYPGMNSLIPGERITGQLYKFKDVPMSNDTWIVAVGIAGIYPSIGMEKLNSEKSKDVIINMESTTLDDFMSQLRTLD